MRNGVALSWVILYILHISTPVFCMKFDPDRIAARVEIDRKWDEIELIKSRKGRQIQPKEISIQVTAPLFSSRLFEYGSGAGDSELPQALDVGKKLDLTNPISFFGSDYKTIYILSNGAIGFEAGARSYKSGVLPGPTRLLAPFWNRNDLRNGGKVFYREVTKGRVLERGQSEIRYQYDKTVKVNSALIITWDKMQPLNTAALPDENTNTFQAAIFITANGTFSNFIYSNIGWTQGAEAGFNAGDATNHFKLPTSGSSNIMYLEEYGNTGIPGEWMFELSELRVISCKAGIKGDTCDQECSNGEWGPDCAYCCHCSEGTCHAATGDCPRGCATCWAGVACQTREEKCATKTQCASNALSFNDYDRCGEPIQKCRCLNGYKGDGYKKCDDIDECATNSTICHHNAVCTNTPGRFFCQCKEGYSGDGQTECSQSFLFQYDTHRQLPRKKNSKMEWNLKTPMKIFGDITDKITITSTGMIAINEVNGEGSRLEDMQLVGIAPFFAPIDVSRGGSVSVDEINDIEVLRRVTRTIAENYNDPVFDAKNVLIVTYSNVTDGKQTKGNTFQTLLIDGTGARNERMTFAELMYRDIAWSNGAEAGILSKDSSTSILLPASGTEAISQLSKNSNIKQPGTWLYRIDRPTLMACAQPIQVPPYCDHILNTGGSSRLPKVVDEKKEDLTLPPPGAFLIDQPSEVIRPTLVRGNNGGAPNRNTITVTSAPIANRPHIRTTTRARPNFSSTPHRPIVSLSDEDFNIGPDAFEATFAPFVTVVPELFKGKDKMKSSGQTGGKSTQRPLPDFSIKTPLKEKIVSSTTIVTTTRTPTTTMRIEEEMSENGESPFETGSFDGESVRFTDENEEKFETKKQRPNMMITQPTTIQQQRQSENVFGDARVVMEEEEEEVVEEEETTTTTTTTTTMTPTTTSGQPSPAILLFTTTTRKPMKMMTTMPRRVITPSVIVTGSPKQANPIDTNTIEEGQVEEQSDKKLAFMVPVGIILTWIAILICIAVIVCCKKRNSRDASQLRGLYGASYGIRPTSYESKRHETSYEDHLERATRLGASGSSSGGSGGQSTGQQQAGKISLYGSYWNLQPIQSHSPARLSTQERMSPPSFINNGYTNPTRYQYAGHY